MSDLTRYYVPEEHCFEDVDKCFEAFPDQAATVLVSLTKYGELRRHADKLAEALDKHLHSFGGYVGAEEALAEYRKVFPAKEQVG